MEETQKQAPQTSAGRVSEKRQESVATLRLRTTSFLSYAAFAFGFILPCAQRCFVPLRVRKILDEEIARKPV